MNKKIFTFTISILIFTFTGCSYKMVNLADNNLNVVNREVSSIDKTTNTITLNGSTGAGLAIIEDIDFEDGTIEIDLKGENNPGMSFVGIAFNIQNDSTYEAIYFRS